MGQRAKPRKSRETSAKPYRHPEAKTLLRPEVGTQAQFKKKKPPATYRYDSSLSPALEWDESPSRERGEALIRRILDAKTIHEAQSAAAELKKLSAPFLNWAGKAERSAFTVPTLPLFVHERLATKAIIETLKSHKKVKDEQLTLSLLFGDPQHSVTDQVLRAYEYQDEWVNRMILGDSLVVMNSLLQYEGLGGQVQMIYMDPPYGVKFGSNFQPFVRKRDVKHNDDADMTREPEMVQAYRDTWVLNTHSYLTYLRDRLLLARELLTHSGSIFVQISDENLHHVRELLDEVFGEDNACPLIVFQKTTGAGSPSGRTDFPPVTNDFLLWYAKDKSRVQFNPVFLPKVRGEAGATQYDWIEVDGERRQATAEEKADPPERGRFFAHDNLTSQTGGPTTQFEVVFEGARFYPRKGGWKTNSEGMERLRVKKRLIVIGDSLRYVRYMDDFPCSVVTNSWLDTVISGFGDPKVYVVQTTTKVVERCLQMTTKPGDLVLDPTCGSGTTAYVAEQWGRRWLTIDCSRVPLALSRQRLLTATYPWYLLKDEHRGPGGGFVYKRRQNNRGEDVGGIVPHVTLGSIANSEPPREEVLVDRPEVDSSIVRVSGPFVVEATIPTPMDWEAQETEGGDVAEGREPYGSFVERMLEVLRRSPVLQLGAGKTATFKNVRPPAKTLSLSAEAAVANGKETPVALIFGPENGAVSERLVYEAAREARAKAYHHLYVIGFAIQANARQLVENCDATVGIPATYVQATPDLLMGDLLKNMRSSQIFSVCGLPEVKVKKAKATKEGEPRYEVELLGLDVFDPVAMATDHKSGDDVPAWLLDTDYNGRCFHVSQAFFPRTAAWDSLKKALKATHEESVWAHLAGTVSAPFEAGEHRQVAVKVIDDRGNELLVVASLDKDAR